MKERRRVPRIDLMFFARVHDRRTGDLLGHLVNITPQGAMILGEDPLKPGDMYEIRIELPDAYTEKNHLDFEARCSWCARDINPDYFGMGFQFKDVTPQDAALIKRMIEDFGFRP